MRSETTQRFGLETGSLVVSTDGSTTPGAPGQDWLAIARAHREIIKQGEAGFYSLSRNNRSRLWSAVGDLNETGIIGPWTLGPETLDNPNFIDEIGESDDACFIGLGCIDSRRRAGDDWVDVVQPLFIREVDVTVVDQYLKVSPESGKWSPTPVLFDRIEQVGAGRFDDVEPILARALERAQRVAEHDGRGFSAALVDQVLGDFPGLEGRLAASTTSYVLFVEPRGVSNFNMHLMRDYDALVSRLAEDPTDIGGLRVLERLGDVDPAEHEDPSDFVPLNDSQREAVRAILGHEHVTAVSGPPGCGKSQVVMSVILNAWRLGIRTLFASTNNQAVDVVLERLHRFESDYPVVVRAGAQKRARVYQAMEHASAIVERAKRTGATESSDDRTNELRNRREELQTALRDGIHSKIDQQRNAALNAYASSARTRAECAETRNGLLDRLAGIHPDLTTSGRADAEHSAALQWFDERPAVRSAIDEDTRRRHDRAESRRRAESTRRGQLDRFEFPVDEDLAWLATPGTPDESARWVRRLVSVIEGIPGRDVEEFPWLPEYDRFASSQEARTRVGEADRLSSELRTNARTASERLERREQCRELCSEAVAGLRSLGVDPEVVVPTEVLNDWLAEHRVSAADAADWKASLPFGHCRQARRRLDAALARVRDHLPASLWEQINNAENSPHGSFLPIGEAFQSLSVRQANLTQAEEEVAEIEKFVDEQARLAARLELPPLDLVDVERAWVEHARVLEEAARNADKAADAWSRHEQVEQTAATIREIRSELEAKAAAAPPWRAFLSGPGQPLRASLQDLEGSPTPQVLQVAREVLSAGTADEFIQAWSGAHRAHVEIEELDRELNEIPTSDQRIGSWWQGRPTTFLHLETPEDLPAAGHPAVAHAGRIADWVAEWEEFTTTTGPAFEQRAADELERADTELRRAASSVPGEVGAAVQTRIDEILTTGDPWPVAEMNALFEQFDPRSLEADIAGIDAQLEADSFADAKRAWLERVTANADGLEATGRLATAYRRNLRVQPRATEDFERMLDVLPVWIVTGQSAQSIPLEPGMFDLVVIDEATQCTLTNLLPLLYRAKRIVVIGDRHQLQPIPNISVAQEEALFAKHGLAEVDYWLRHNENDVYGVGINCLPGREGDVRSLDEHYRSNPLIIGFSNRHIYRQALELRRPLEERTGADYPPGVYLRHVSGHAQRRSTSWVNEPEAEAAVEIATDLLGESFISDVGIVTPFRPQADLINELLENRRITGVKAAAVDAFQGGERDAMVFSPVMARGMRPGTVAWASQENRVNVAVTRAREVLVVVADTDFCRGQDGIIKELVNYCALVERIRESSPAELKLFGLLMLEGIQCHNYVVIADMEEEFVIGGRVRDVVARVDGGQHFESRAADEARKATLAANGYQVIDFTGAEVLETPDYVIGEIRRTLDDQ
jgi:very-short-patch-repair endonuclease